MEHEEMSTMALPDLGVSVPPTDGAGVLPCREHDANLWFAESAQDVEMAKGLCRDCPLRAQCLAGALRRQEPWGVWGGQVFVQGRIVAYKRSRGRPRKNPLAA